MNIEIEQVVTKHWQEARDRLMCGHYLILFLLLLPFSWKKKLNLYNLLIHDELTGVVTYSLSASNYTILHFYYKNSDRTNYTHLILLQYQFGTGHLLKMLTMINCFSHNAFPKLFLTWRLFIKIAEHDRG